MGLHANGFYWLHTLQYKCGSSTTRLKRKQATFLNGQHYACCLFCFLRRLKIYKLETKLIGKWREEEAKRNVAVDYGSGLIILKYLWGIVTKGFRACMLKIQFNRSPCRAVSSAEVKSFTSLLASGFVVNVKSYFYCTVIKASIYQ